MKDGAWTRRMCNCSLLFDLKIFADDIANASVRRVAILAKKERGEHKNA